MHNQLLQVHLCDELDQAQREFLDFCRSKNLSPHTVGYYRDRLDVFFDFCRRQVSVSNPGAITRAVVRAFISYSTEHGHATKTVNHAITALKAFYGFRVAEGLESASPLLGIKPLRCEKKIVQTFSTEQVNLLLDQCDRHTFVGLRDYTVMLTLLDTGLRVSELCGLRLEDIDWQDGFLKVMGKGSKERVVPFGRSLSLALKDYLRHRGEFDRETHVFLSQFAGPLDRSVVRVLISRLGRKAGLTGVRVSPHTFRHTFAKNWIMNGGDPFSLQRILGHTTQYMVSQYVNLAVGDLRVQHSRFSPVDNMSPNSRGRKVVLR